MIGALSVALAGYELAAWRFGWRTVSRQRGLPLALVFLWWGALGVHLAIEALSQDLAEKTAANFVG